MKIKQFQVGQMGELYLLPENEDSIIYQGELEHIMSPDQSSVSDIRVNIIRKIIIE